MTGPTIPTPDRAAWLRAMRREDERQEDALAPEYDAQWGEIGETHAAFVAALLAKLPPQGRVLDAACGTGKYFGMVLGSGRAPFGVDHSRGALAVAAAKFPQVRTERHLLQDLPFRVSATGCCASTPWSSSRPTIGRGCWSASTAPFTPTAGST